MLKENVSLFSSKISLRSLHMCETIIIHSIRDNERERDTLCLASSFEREEGIILSRFLLRVKKEATTTTTTTTTTAAKNREQCSGASSVERESTRAKEPFRAASSYYFRQKLESESRYFFSSSSLSLSRENKSARALKRAKTSERVDFYKPRFSI